MNKRKKTNKDEPVTENNNKNEKQIMMSDAVFPIVGIGASAGGLAAFEAFFSGMPADIDPGMAFVLVQHLAPDHKSILSELVRRYTRMQVFEVKDGMTVRPNCTYIIPPNCDMAFLNGTLQLMEPTAPRGQRLPIDFFFRSLANDQHERAICIVLSGTGSDGTIGVRAIKGEGGMVMVQNPESTEYDGMPRSALATGLVDYKLTPTEMPAQLIAYAAHAFSSRLPRVETIPMSQTENMLKKIFVLLRAQTGHDFSMYKTNTIQRRIERRMAVNQINTLEEYVKYSQQTPSEIEKLFRDLLIGVTNFFRDEEAFKTLEEKVIPNLFSSKPPGSVVRVWCPGCSTGEEAYSIAILMLEHLEKLQQNYSVQVFATDIDSQAITTARAGLYPASIISDITPERLVHFFTCESEGNAYRIHKNIRDMLIFSEQNVIKDPPFSKIDLISCRNLLIYMGGELQKKLIPLFHYALNPGGILFLGTSETIGEFGDLFIIQDHKSKLFLRKDDFHSSQQTDFSRFLQPATTLKEVFPRTANNLTSHVKLPLRQLTEQTLLDQVVPSAALINELGDILYLHGRTGRYLELSPGETGVNNILKMAREGLKRDLTTTLHKAVGTKETIHCPGIQVKTNGGYTKLDLSIFPVTPNPSLSHQGLLYLVILKESLLLKSINEEQLSSNKDNPEDINKNIATLKQELQAKEEYLRSANEELETSNEELKSSNEEMQSINEELQSTNEELETSKEELQSVNEELATVNAELQNKVADLSRVNNDMNNLLAGTGIGTIFVDLQMRILRFTPAVVKIINLIHSDVGRPIGHIVSNLINYNHLTEDVQTVLDTLISKEVEVQMASGAYYSLRIQPYRTLDNVIEGAVISFVNITSLKQTEEALNKSKSYKQFATAIRDTKSAFIVQDLQGFIQVWNPGAEKLYGWGETEALQKNINDLNPEKMDSESLYGKNLLTKVNIPSFFRLKRKTKDGRIVDVWATVTALVNESGQVYALATIERELK